MSPRSGARRVLVVCIGNSLVADDGVGPQVHERLQQMALPPGAQLRYLGVGGMALLDELDGEDGLIVVDAVQLGSPPGTLHVLDWEDLPAAQAPVVSVHGIGVREALEVARHLFPERLPGCVVLVGLEGRRFTEVGGAMTPEVESALPCVVDEVLRQLASALE